ncbi:MAG TPA: DUF971 domain-containing protein [Polyangiaceae bacterium]|jgi:DUF971 family protein|nr:DUF971 domain-containing protein [Polyangiaceae bacterium]
MDSSKRHQPTQIKAPHGATSMHIGWGDGVSTDIPHWVLRGYCPCASCQGHGGAIHFVEGGNLEIREMEQVGNYALSFTWGDRHNTGIYTFRFLRALGELFELHGAELPKLMPELPRSL